MPRLKEISVSRRPGKVILCLKLCAGGVLERHEFTSNRKAKDKERELRAKWCVDLIDVI